MRAVVVIIIVVIVVIMVVVIVVNIGMIALELEGIQLFPKRLFLLRD